MTLNCPTCRKQNRLLVVSNVHSIYNYWVEVHIIGDHFCSIINTVYKHFHNMLLCLCSYIALCVGGSK